MSAQPSLAPNFSDILDKPASETEKPKPLPVGGYVCVVKGLPRRDKSSKKGTPFVEFTLQPLEVLEDVDADELTAMGGFTNKTIKATYYLTDDALWRLKDFLEHCGIEIADGASYSQLIEETPNCQVIAYLRHEASEDGTSIYARLGKTAPISA